MELNKIHRQALLMELDKANEDLTLKKKCLRDSEIKKDGLKEWWEVSVFLAEKRIDLIKTSVEDNEIDY